MSSSTDEWCIDSCDLINLFTKMNYMPDFDCMASRKNAICKNFYSKIPQIGSKGVNFLSQKLSVDVKYFCCPPVKMIGRVACHLLDHRNVTCLLIVPVWPSAAFWPALQQSPRFQSSVSRERRFRPKFFMSNGARSLFRRSPKFEMVAFLLKTWVKYSTFSCRKLVSFHGPQWAVGHSQYLRMFCFEEIKKCFVVVF